MKRVHLVAALVIGLVACGATSRSSASPHDASDPSRSSSHASPGACKLHGKVQFVTSFPDYKVQVVNSFPDAKVKKVTSFPDNPGEWQVVDSFPDFTVQVVDSFPDFTVQYVESFPGCP